MEMTPLRHKTEKRQTLSRHIFVRVSQSVGRFKVGPALSIFREKPQNSSQIPTRSQQSWRSHAVFRKGVLPEQGETMNWKRNKQTSAMGLAICSVLAILAASSAAEAQ